MAEKFYVKKYLLKGYHMELTNPEPMMEYVQEKVNELMRASNEDEELNIKLEILREFKKIYEYDLQYAEMPEPFGYFKDEKEKEAFRAKKLWSRNFVDYLCNIFSNYHEQRYLKSEKIKMINVSKTMINYKELYERAICDYYLALLRLEHPLKVTEKGKLICEPPIKKYENTGNYGHAVTATFVLPSLIEFYLGNALQKKLLFESIRKLDMNKVVLDDEEKKIIGMFLGQQQSGQTIIFHGPQEYIMGKMYSLFIKEGILKENKKNKKNKMILTGEGRSLGEIIHSPYAEKQIRPEYMYILDNMFSTKKMNLRNNIMHGNNATYDYLGVGIVSVMIEILWSIGYKTLFNSK